MYRVAGPTGMVLEALEIKVLQDERTFWAVLFPNEVWVVDVALGLGIVYPSPIAYPPNLRHLVSLAVRVHAGGKGGVRSWGEWIRKAVSVRSVPVQVRDDGVVMQGALLAPQPPVVWVQR